MSQMPYSRRDRHDAGEGRPPRRPEMHPLEEMLRLIDRESPDPFYPAEFLQRTQGDPAEFDVLLQQLASADMIEKVRGRSLESGAGVLLTLRGRETLHDPELLRRFVGGETTQGSDVGSVIRQGMQTPVRPYVTYAMLALNVGLFLLGYADKNAADWMRNNLSTRRIPIQDGEWWRLLTGAFVYPDAMLLIFCALSLYSTGAFVEQAWGRWRALVIYLVSAWAGNCVAVQYSADPRPGASGAVCGLMAASAVWYLIYYRHLPGDFARRGLFRVALSVGLIALLTYLFPGGSRAGYFSGYVGGAIGGLAAALVMHVQRFGLPLMPRKAVALRSAIAVLLLLAVPLASYLQMQRTWASKGAGVAKKDKREGGRKVEEEEKEEGRKFAEKKDEDAAPSLFVRHVLLPAYESADAVLQICEKVPLNLKKAKENEANNKDVLSKLTKNQKEIDAAREGVEKARHGKKKVNDGRAEALKLLAAATELRETVRAYLKEPTDEGKEKVKSEYENLNKSVNDFNDLLNELKRLQPIMLPINDTLTIPEAELSFTYARSGGPGGQNVNKVSSKAVLRWTLAASDVIAPHVKERIARRERKRVTTEGELVIASQRYRDQERNREDCLARLREIVLAALVEPKVRRATKPTKGSKRRRLDEKKRRSEVKEGRRGVGE